MEEGHHRIDYTQLQALSERQQSHASANTREVLHAGVHCVGCGARRILGILYQCPLCICVNLCEQCEEHEERRTTNGHPKEHAFLKIRIPQHKQQEQFEPIGNAGPIAWK